MGESRSGRVYGRVSQLFTVRPRADCDTESLTAALSYVARAKLETTLTDTAAAAKAESEKHGSKVWPLCHAMQGQGGFVCFCFAAPVVREKRRQGDGLAARGGAAVATGEHIPSRG